MTWYFAEGYPEEYKKFFTDKGGIVDQTNAIFTAANATIRMEVKISIKGWHWAKSRVFMAMSATISSVG